MRDYREVTLWKDVTAEQWNDWRWQVANRITTLEDCLLYTSRCV